MNKYFHCVIMHSRSSSAVGFRSGIWKHVRRYRRQHHRSVFQRESKDQVPFRKRSSDGYSSRQESRDLRTTVLEVRRLHTFLYRHR